MKGSSTAGPRLEPRRIPGREPQDRIEGANDLLEQAKRMLAGLDAVLCLDHFRFERVDEHERENELG